MLRATDGCMSRRKVSPAGRHRRRGPDEGLRTLAKERVERDEEDLVRLYLTDIGQYPLLTKDDEVRLAQTIEAGRDAEQELGAGKPKDLTPAKRRELKRKIHDRRAGPADLRAVEPPPGGVDRQEVPGVGPSPARPHPGGQPRA